MHEVTLYHNLLLLLSSTHFSIIANKIRFRMREQSPGKTHHTHNITWGSNDGHYEDCKAVYFCVRPTFRRNISPPSSSSKSEPSQNPAERGCSIFLIGYTQIALHLGREHGGIVSLRNIALSQNYDYLLIRSIMP
jgi:hypothetical protein